MEKLRVTVVAACYNEATTLHELADRVRKALDQSGVEGRLLVVDDGSSDETHRILTELAAGDPRIGFLRLSRNFGQQAAVSAGIDHAGGDAVVLLDGDLQDPPELIPELIARFREGYDVVYGVRESRDEAAWKRGAYRTFYRLLSALADIEIPPNAGDFGLMSRRVVEVIRASRERHRFVRGLRTWAGFRQAGLSYHRPKRLAGAPKYTLRKLLRLGMDGLVAFSSAPLQAASLLGFVAALAAAVYLGFGILSRIFYGPIVPGWASLVAAVIGMGGIQLVVLGVIGEYIGRIYDETKGRPVYVVSEARNVAREGAAPPLGLRVGPLETGAAPGDPDRRQ